MTGGEAALLAALCAATLGLALALRAARLRLRRIAVAEARGEQSLAQSQQELARLVLAIEGAGGGLLVLDEQHRIVLCNMAAAELAGLPPGGARGRPLPDVVAWPQLRERLQALAAADSASPGTAFEIAEDGHQGRSLVVGLRRLGGHGFAVSVEDQSRIKRLESLRRDFVANVSHELKTPLAAIQGFVETLQDDPEMPVATRQRFLERLARQCDRLSALVADLLTLSRLDEDHPATESEPCELVAIVRETLKDLGPLAEKKELQVQATLPDAKLWLRGDRESLRQVVGNLVDNAIKYTQTGGRITVQVTAQGGQAVIAVADTGIGLSPADQERVFERFYRVDRARSREVGGTGLGLSIVKHTVRGLGGEVSVQSVLGEGSTFVVRLPILAGPTG